MLVRNDILLNRIKSASDTLDDSTFESPFVYSNYLEDVHKWIQKILFTSDDENNIFVKNYVIQTTPGVSTYDLPSDIFAGISINSVFSIINGTEIGRKYYPQVYGEKITPYGYTIQNNQIVFNSNPSNNILVNYNYRLPSLGLRVGKVNNIIGQDINLTSVIPGFDSYFEYVTAVDRKGNIIQDELYIENLNVDDLTVSGDLTNVTTDHYLVGGYRASSHCFLPDEVEPYLKRGTEKLLLAHVNSAKIEFSRIFSAQEQEELTKLYERASSDIQTPYITDTDYLDI